MRSIVLEGPSRRMSACDAGFLYLERPHSPLSIGCVAVTHGEVARDALFRHLDSHIGTVHRYGQRAVPAPLSLAHPAWRPDPDFDLRNHLHHQGLPRPGGDHELCEAVADLCAKPLERSRPLWEAHLLDGLSGDRAAVLLRVHHCMADGVAGMGLLESLLDTDASGRPRTAPTPEGDEAQPDSALRRIGLAMSDAATAALHQSRQAAALLNPTHWRDSLAPAGELARWLFDRIVDGPSRLPWSGPVGPRRQIAFSRFPLDDARAIRTAAGTTVNDVVLCALAGGLRRYLESIGIDPRGLAVVAAVPVSVRAPTQDDALGNRVGALLVPLALEPREELERLRQTAAITRRLKQVRAYDAVAALLAAAELMPPPVAAWIGHHARLPDLAGVIATNVHGPATPRFLAGRRVEALYPIVPIADGLGLGLAVLSYDGYLYVGLNADADRVPDLEKLRAGIEESMYQLSIRV